MYIYIYMCIAPRTRPAYPLSYGGRIFFLIAPLFNTFKKLESGKFGLYLFISIHVGCIYIYIHSPKTHEQPTTPSNHELIFTHRAAFQHVQKARVGKDASYIWILRGCIYICAPPQDTRHKTNQPLFFWTHPPRVNLNPSRDSSRERCICRISIYIYTLRVYICISPKETNPAIPSVVSWTRFHPHRAALQHVQDARVGKGASAVSLSTYVCCGCIYMCITPRHNTQNKLTPQFF